MCPAIIVKLRTFASMNTTNTAIAKPPSSANPAWSIHCSAMPPSSGNIAYVARLLSR